MKSKLLFPAIALLTIFGLSLGAKVQTPVKETSDPPKLHPQEESMANLTDNIWMSYKVDCSGNPIDLFNLYAKRAEDALLDQAPQLTNEQEEELGDEMHTQIGSEMQIIDSDPRRAQLKDMMNKMLSFIDRQGISYDIHLVNSSEINAFAINGGHLYITTALMDFVSSTDELAVIIGHEIGHVDKKHCLRKIQKILLANQLLGDDFGVVAAQINMVLTAPFGQVDEYEADKVGAYLAHKAGFDPMRGLDFFKKLKEQENYNLIEKLTRTHPFSEERERCLQQYIETELN